MTRALDKQLLWLCVLLLISASLGGCAIFSDFQPSVWSSAIALDEYIAEQRGNIISTSQLSALTVQTVLVTSLNLKECDTHSSPNCISALADTQGI